jgi:UDP-N-acetylmuramate dehydrogenase
MKLEKVAEALRERVKGAVETDHPLARFTTYRLGGPAALYVEPHDTGDLEVLGDVLRTHGLSGGRLPVLPLGRGSNMVISDAGWPGLVVRLGDSFARIEPWSPDASEHGARVGAAVSMPQVANWAARRGLSGFEWAISIPGSMGGGVKMNAGAHGGEVGDVLVSATVLDLGSFTIRELEAAALDLSYRHSNLTPTDLVLEARLLFSPEDAAVVKARMEDYRKHRAATQPGALQNAGSVFKNPPGDSAGRLVEAAGLKGFSVGEARVSELHANFFIAGDGSRAQDVFDLVHAVKQRVLDGSGVELVPEIRFIGAFEQAATDQ